MRRDTTATTLVPVTPISKSGPIYLISGPMAAEKSTVARLLAERFDRGVHLEGDFFRRSIVSGRVEMTPHASPEATAQLRLRYRLAAAAADTYSQADFTVVLEGPHCKVWKPCHGASAHHGLQRLDRVAADPVQRWPVSPGAPAIRARRMRDGGSP
jgi:hypothetical protein